MAERKDLNSITARTLRNTLEIPRKLSSAIAAYRRRKGNFKHIDELWKVPGMTRKIHENICQRYFVSGQRPTMMGEPEPYVCTSLQRTVESVSEIHSNKRNKSRRSSNLAVGTTGYNADDLNPVARPEPNGKSPRVEGLGISEFDSGTGNTSVVPISVQESPSGEKLCIVYKRTSKGSCWPPHIVNGEMVKEPSLELGSTKETPLHRPRGILPSRTPSPAKPHTIQKKMKKSHLERPRQTPESRNDGNRDQSPAKTFRTARNTTPSPKKDPPDDAAANEQIRVEEYYSEHIERVCEPSTSMPFGQSVGSSEKVSEWINSNVDFMKHPRPAASFWQTIASSPFDAKPSISGQKINFPAFGEKHVSGKLVSPKSKEPVSFSSDQPEAYTIHETRTYRRQMPDSSVAPPVGTGQQFTSFTKDRGKSKCLNDKKERHMTGTTIFRRKKHNRWESTEKRARPVYQSHDSPVYQSQDSPVYQSQDSPVYQSKNSEAEPSSLQCVLI